MQPPHIRYLPPPLMANYTRGGTSDSRGSSEYSRIGPLSIDSASSRAALPADGCSGGGLTRVSAKSRQSDRVAWPSSLAGPKVWLLCQAALVAAFALCCLVLRILESPRTFADDGSWMHLIFDKEAVNLCENENISGCLENRTALTYRTTRKDMSMGPLVCSSASRNILGCRSHATANEALQLMRNSQLETTVLITQSAEYRVAAQVTFRDIVGDLMVRLSVKVNGVNWMHCEQSNKASMAATRCTLFGIRYLRAKENVTFNCPDEFRVISISDMETFFTIERR